MDIVYFDCSSGISGDMALAAFVDLGVPAGTIESALESLPLDGYSLRWERAHRAGISANRAIVETQEGHVHRGLGDVLEIIRGGHLSEKARGLAEAIFRRLAEAEAEVHGTTVENIHFHEVGAADAIIDIVGAAVAAASLGDVRFVGSPVRTGFGTISIAHGEYPVPAPGTASLLRGVPVFGGEIEGEWCTPTGAAILTTLCSHYGPMPAMTMERIGHGAGSKEHRRLPNVLRLIGGESAKAQSCGMIVMETQVDDASPELLGHLGERLSDSGAVDWFITPVLMKKNRPGHLITVHCKPEQREAFSALLFAETTTIGCRWYGVEREELEREVVSVETELGPIRVKIARRNGEIVNVAPEFEDCREAARRGGLPLKQVQHMAVFAWRQQKK